MRRPRERERESLDTCYTPLLQHIHWASSQICANIGFFSISPDFTVCFGKSVRCVEQMHPVKLALSLSRARHLPPRHPLCLFAQSIQSALAQWGRCCVYIDLCTWSTVTAQDILHLHYGTSRKSKPNRDQGLSRPSRSEGASKRTEFANSFTSSASGDCSHATSSEKRRNASAASPPAMAR